MYRQTSIRHWKKKKPLEGKTKARSGYCLSDHFHRSGLEIKTCDELRLRKLAGDIKSYRREVRIPLVIDGLNLGVYICDFVVEENDGRTTYVEAKGIAFPLWKKKWAILQHMHKGDLMYGFQVVTR